MYTNNITESTIAHSVYGLTINFITKKLNAWNKTLKYLYGKCVKIASYMYILCKIEFQSV